MDNSDLVSRPIFYNPGEILTMVNRETELASTFEESNGEYKIFGNDNSKTIVFKKCTWEDLSSYISFSHFMEQCNLIKENKDISEKCTQIFNYLKDKIELKDDIPFDCDDIEDCYYHVMIYKK